MNDIRTDTPDPKSFTKMLPLCAALNMEVDAVAPAEATLSLPYSDDLIGDPATGVIHGGAVSILLDSACGLAVYMHPDNAGDTATIDLRIDYMRPAAPGKPVIARAVVYHATRTVAFLRATAWVDDPDKPVAMASGAFVFNKKARA